MFHFTHPSPKACAETEPLLLGSFRAVTRNGCGRTRGSLSLDSAEWGEPRWKSQTSNVQAVPTTKTGRKGKLYAEETGLWSCNNCPGLTLRCSRSGISVRP